MANYCIYQCSNTSAAADYPNECYNANQTCSDTHNSNNCPILGGETFDNITMCRKYQSLELTTSLFGSYTSDTSDNSYYYCTHTSQVCNNVKEIGSDSNCLMESTKCFNNYNECNNYLVNTMIMILIKIVQIMALNYKIHCRGS